VGFRLVLVPSNAHQAVLDAGVFKGFRLTSL
jgi:hypothetical protein